MNRQKMLTNVVDQLRLSQLDLKPAHPKKERFEEKYRKHKMFSHIYLFQLNEKIWFSSHFVHSYHCKHRQYLQILFCLA